MSGKSLDYSTLFAKDLPLPVGQWQGHPKYNFIGGQSDPELEPMEQFIESAKPHRHSHDHGASAPDPEPQRRVRCPYF